MLFCCHHAEEEHHIYMCHMFWQTTARDCVLCCVDLWLEPGENSFILVNIQCYLLRFDLKIIHIWIENSGKVALSYPEYDSRAERFDP